MTKELKVLYVQMKDRKPELQVVTSNTNEIFDSELRIMNLCYLYLHPLDDKKKDGYK